MTSRKLICVIGMIFAAFSRSSNADVIFDDFGPGNGVLGAMSWDVNAGFATTAEFTSHASYTLTQIDVYLVNGVGGGTNAATISLRSAGIRDGLVERIWATNVCGWSTLDNYLEY